MDYLKLYDEAIENRFKIQSVINQICKEVEFRAIKQTYEKYKDSLISKDGMQFVLIGVTCYCLTGDRSDDTVQLALNYVACSKLPKDKTIAVDKAKDDYLKDKRLPWSSNHKYPLWYTLRFNISINKVLDETINLNIAF